MAPGVLISTTDRQGILGYNPNFAIHPANGGTLVANDYADQNYTTWFNGTSSAAPQVAGITALILSVNPSLTQQEVRNIIESTAEKVGGYTYTLGAGEQATLSWNSEMGYGRINAHAAVLAALPPISDPDLLCSSSPYTLDDVPAGSTVTWSAAPAFLFTNTSGSGNTFTTAPASINGQGTITATVTGTCGATSISRNIQVGPPTRINGLSQNQIICDNQYINLFSEFGYLSYNWMVLGGTVVSGQGTAQVTVLTDNNPFQGYNMISVRLDVTSTCMDGTSETTAYVNNCGGSPIDPMIYPNPATDELTIELNYIDEGVKKEEKIVEISVFDNRGTELYKQTTSEDKGY